LLFLLLMELLFVVRCEQNLQLAFRLGTRLVFRPGAHVLGLLFSYNYGGEFIRGAILGERIRLRSLLLLLMFRQVRCVDLLKLVFGLAEGAAQRVKEVFFDCCAGLA